MPQETEEQREERITSAVEVMQTYLLQTFPHAFMGERFEWTAMALHPEASSLPQVASVIAHIVRSFGPINSRDLVEILKRSFNINDFDVHQASIYLSAEGIYLDNERNWVSI